MKRNEASYDLDRAWTYQDSINSDNWFGLLPGQAKLCNIAAKRHYENDVFYWETTYEFHVRPLLSNFAPGWTLSLLDQGFEYINANGARQLILDDKGRPVTKAWPLDGNGGKLAVGGSPVYKQWTIYNQLPFADLGLP